MREKFTRLYSWGKSNEETPEEANSKWKEVGDSREDHDIEALRKAHSDVQRTLDHHLDVFSDVANKSSRLFRFSGLVLTILATVGSQAGYQSYLNIPVILGLICLGGAGVIGLIGQAGQRVPVGPGEREIKILEEGKLTEEEYLRWIIQNGYTNWIDIASEKSYRKAVLVEIGNVLSICGVVLLSGGILLSL